MSEKLEIYFPEKGARGGGGVGGQRPFKLFPKNHPFWRIQASLTDQLTGIGARDVSASKNQLNHTLSEL